MSFRWQIAQWFELRWWKRYLQGKDKADYLSWKRAYWQRVLNLIGNQVKIDATKTIADMGCGPAGIFIALPNNNITAVDPLIAQYEAQLPFFKKNDYPNTTFINSTIEDFETTEKFDLVFCMNAINHVADIEKGIEKLKSICKEHGLIVLSIDAHNYSFFKYLFKLIPGDVLHPHQYDLKGYRGLLKKNGWKVSVPYLLKEEFFFDHYILIAHSTSPYE